MVLPPSVAPNHICELLASESWDSDAGILAVQTVTTQLENHETRRNHHAQDIPDTEIRIPTLFNAAVKKLANSIGQDAEEDLKSLEAMEGLPPNALSRIALKLENIPYDMLCRVRQLAGDDEGEVDEWVLRNEVWLREISAKSEQQVSTSKRFRRENATVAQGPQQFEWQRGIVRLSTHAGTVFSGSELTGTCRTITRPPSLPGFKILDGRRPPTVRIQPSVDLFSKTFETMISGLLKGLNWDHVFVAGGIVLGALLCTDDQDTTNTPDQWKDSDVDLYIYGLGPVEANKKIEHIFSVFKSNLPQDVPVLVVRNSKTITFFSKYPLRRIQVVLKLVESPKDVLLNFDLDICAIGWDGKEVWMLPRAARALETGYTVFTMDLINGHYLGDRRATQEERVFKYADKGYGIRILPSYLKEFQMIKDDMEKQKALGIVNNDDHRRRKQWKMQGFDELVANARNWTANVVRGIAKNISPHIQPAFAVPIASHAWLQERYQVSEDPQRRSALSNLTLFLRHVALWEHEVAGTVIIEKNSWAAPIYDGIYPDKFGIGYNDIPEYSWDDNFTTGGFATSITSFNNKEDGALVRSFSYLFEKQEYASRFNGDNLLAKYLANPLRTQRTTHASSVQDVLGPKCDIYLPVWLPRSFIDFADDLISAAVRESGVPKYTSAPFTQALKDDAPASIVDAEGLRLVFWRITNVTMWQQLSRKIDEVHEVLWSFHHANANMDFDQTTRQALLVRQFARRTIRMTAQDEYGSFARWVARLPANFTNYNNEIARYLDPHTDDEPSEEDEA